MRRAGRRFSVAGQGGTDLMGDPTPEHLEVLEEIERDGLPGLGEVLRREGLEAGATSSGRPRDGTTSVFILSLIIHLAHVLSTSEGPYYSRSCRRRSWGVLF